MSNVMVGTVMRTVEQTRAAHGDLHTHSAPIRRRTATIAQRLAQRPPWLASVLGAPRLLVDSQRGQRRGRVTPLCGPAVGACVASVLVREDHTDDEVESVVLDPSGQSARTRSGEVKDISSTLLFTQQHRGRLVVDDLGNHLAQPSRM